MVRLLQITLAVYLVPVLSVVALVSGVGMMILGVTQTVFGLTEQGKQVIQGNR
jgi:hypothetical protein